MKFSLIQRVQRKWNIAYHKNCEHFASSLVPEKEKDNVGVLVFHNCTCLCAIYHVGEHDVSCIFLERRDAILKWL